jgi:hypothetical protein
LFTESILTLDATIEVSIPKGKLTFGVLGTIKNPTEDPVSGNTPDAVDPFAGMIGLDLGGHTDTFVIASGSYNNDSSPMRIDSFNEQMTLHTAVSLTLNAADVNIANSKLTFGGTSPIVGEIGDVGDGGQGAFIIASGTASSDASDMYISSFSKPMELFTESTLTLDAGHVDIHGGSGIMRFYQSFDPAVPGATDPNTIIGEIGNINSGAGSNAFTITSNFEMDANGVQVANNMYISSGAGILTFNSVGIDIPATEIRDNTIAIAALEARIAALEAAPAP